MGLFEAQLAELVLADVLDVPAGRVQAQPTGAVDVADTQRPFATEYIGWPSGTGIIDLSRLTALLPVVPSSRTSG